MASRRGAVRHIGARHTETAYNWPRRSRAKRERRNRHLSRRSHPWARPGSRNSSTLPCISYRPKALAAKRPAGAGHLSSQRPPQPSQLARLRPMASPQLYLVVVPARAAYSHSASLGSR